MQTLNFSRLWLLQLVIIFAAVWGVYWHTLDVPFYMDDFSSIQENPLIYNWQGIGALWEYAPARIFGYLSFALNYHLHQFNTTGFHVLNILLHSLMGMAIYALLRGLLTAPHVRETAEQQPWLLWLPLLAALLFVLHPLHIQAVTYIVQRLAAMAALFYVAAMAAFVQARLAQTANRRWLWAGLCVLFALLALLTKQNTATLPMALLLLEAVFFSQDRQRLLMLTSAVLGGLFLFWLLLAYGFQYHPFSLENMQAMTRETTTISRSDYLATQMPVIWTYIRLFFLPVGLHVDYDLVPLTGFANFSVIAALLAHLLVLGLALFFVRRFPLPAFAVLFYYLAHSVESSVIPIRDVIFEHRTYLPDMGLSLLTAWLVLLILPLWLHRQTLVLLLVLVLGFLGYATWQRNQVWRDPIALWSNNVELAPNNSRGWSILGKHYLQAKRPLEAINALQRSMQLQQTSGRNSINTVDIINLIVGLKLLKRYEEALQLTQRILQYPMKPLLKAKFLINQGNVYFEMGRVQDAETSLRQAIQVNPNSIIARANLASLLGSTQRFDEAEALYLEVLQIDPDSQITRQNLETLRAMKAQQAQDRQ